MTQVTYRAPKGDEKVVEIHGLTFFDGQAQEIDDEEHAGFLAKARNNPHFLVGDQATAETDEPGQAPKRRGRPPKQAETE